MTRDARQSLIALGTVTLIVGLFIAGLRLSEGVDIPDWVLAAGLLLLMFDFAWRFVRWCRSRQEASEAGDA